METLRFAQGDVSWRFSRKMKCTLAQGYSSRSRRPVILRSAATKNPARRGGCVQRWKFVYVTLSNAKGLEFFAPLRMTYGRFRGIGSSS